MVDCLPSAGQNRPPKREGEAHSHRQQGLLPQSQGTVGPDDALLGGSGPPGPAGEAGDHHPPHQDHQLVQQAPQEQAAPAAQWAHLVGSGCSQEQRPLHHGEHGHEGELVGVREVQRQDP